MRSKRCLEIWCTSYPVTTVPHLRRRPQLHHFESSLQLTGALHIPSSDKKSLLLRAMVTVYHFMHKSTHIKELKAEKRTHCHTLSILLHKTVRSDRQTHCSQLKKLHCSLGSKTKEPSLMNHTVFED